MLASKLVAQLDRLEGYRRREGEDERLTEGEERAVYWSLMRELTLECAEVLDAMLRSGMVTVDVQRGDDIEYAEPDLYYFATNPTGIILTSRPPT
jgi:hypothetical protein